MKTEDLIRVASPFIRVQLLAFFARWIGQGYLTPSDASQLTQWVMDGLAFGIPAAYGAWAAWRATRDNLIKTTDNLDGVVGVVVTPELAAKIASPTVTTPEKLLVEVRSGPDTR
jgi:hypothetical protein